MKISHESKKHAKERIAYEKTLSDSKKLQKLQKKLITGDEFDFKIYNKFNKFDKLQMKRDIRYLDFEINRAENKIKKIVGKPEGVHIRFDKKVSVECVFEFKNNLEIVGKWKEYLKKLEGCKKKILRMIDEN